MTSPQLIKVCLTNRGEDAETPWAEDLGPAPGPQGSRKVRLVNVPFLHAKPTYGDVVVVSPLEDGLLTWDRDGIAWPSIGTRIEEDGGRWAMIIDYVPHDDTTGDAAFEALTKACETNHLICEGAWGPDGTQPGRAYLAVDNSVSASTVMATLEDAALPMRLAQVHPAPATDLSASEPRTARAETVAATPTAKAKVASPAPARRAKPATTSTAKSPAKPAARSKAAASKARPAARSKAAATARSPAKSSARPAKSAARPTAKSKSKSKSKPKSKRR